MNHLAKLTIWWGVIFTVSLAGCASVIRGDQQHLHVDTMCGSRVVPALCTAINDRGRWHFRAPADLVVTRDGSVMHISCSSPYFGSQTLQVSSGLNMSIAGNLLAGGLVGVGVDVLTGAGLSYPRHVLLNYSDCR